MLHADYGVVHASTIEELERRVKFFLDDGDAVIIGPMKISNPEELCGKGISEDEIFYQTIAIHEVVKEYQMVSGKDDNNLSGNVQELIEKGWCLYGAPVYDSRSGYLCQALIRCGGSEET